MSQRDFARHVFFHVLSYGSLAALFASLIAGAVRLFTFAALFGEACDDICDVSGKLFALPFLGVICTVLVLPVLIAVGFTCSLYIDLTFDKYGGTAALQRQLSLLIPVLIVIEALAWCFPIRHLGNPVQTPANTLQWALTAVLAGLLFPLTTRRIRLGNA